MLTACLALLLLGQTPESTRPNVVFLYTDDQRYDALGVVQKEQEGKGRFPWFKTPNMDRIANEGIRFRNAFVVNALCSPSRACFLTGQYSHVNGITNNRTPFPMNANTYSALLGKAGYATGYVGKFHMGVQSGQRPTFSYSASFVGQGKYHDCPVEVNGVRQETKGWIDDVSTDFALDFIRKNKNVPFLLALGFKAPHGPFTPPDRHKNSLQGRLARAVPNMDSPPPFATNSRKAPVGNAEEVPVSNSYFEAIAGVDDNVGKVLNLLDELRLTQNTLVVFSSDNGYYHGEHGLGDKRSAYEESMRIPLLVRYPAVIKKPSVNDELALNIDLAPTVVDIAGIPVPDSMQGKSWKPILEGKETKLREAFLYTYFRENPYFTPTLTAVRTRSAKLVKYPGQDSWTELFDLSKDPYETRNLYGKPGAGEMQKFLEKEHDSQVKSLGYKIPANDDKPMAPVQDIQGSVLEFRATSASDAKITDLSKHQNQGKPLGIKVIESEKKQKVLSFDGRGRIDVAKSKSLDPTGRPFKLEVLMRAEGKTGTILARGGVTVGYALYLSDGKLAFAINHSNKTFVIETKDIVLGKWVLVGVGINDTKQAFLEMDGRVVATQSVGAFLPRDPSDILQIGADTGSPVTPDRGGGNFTGLIESVKLVHGPFTR